MTNGGITILDGGMGRELEKRGAPFKQPEWSALAMMVAPEIVKEVHKALRSVPMPMLFHRNEKMQQQMRG